MKLVLPGPQDSQKTSKPNPTTWFFPFQWSVPTANTQGLGGAGQGGHTSWPSWWCLLSLHLAAYVWLLFLSRCFLLRSPLWREDRSFSQSHYGGIRALKSMATTIPNVHLCNITEGFLLDLYWILAWFWKDQLYLTANIQTVRSHESSTLDIWVTSSIFLSSLHK